MDANDQTQLILELQRQMAELRAQQAQKDAPSLQSPKLAYALDGGPLSDAHKFLQPMIVNTMQVSRKTPTGEFIECLINTSDFNPVTDVDLTAKVIPRTKTEETAKPESKGKVKGKASRRTRAPKVTRETLEALTLPELLALPEADKVENMPDTQEGVVNAILAVS